MIESLLLTAARVSTFSSQRSLTNASGFFFERDGQLFLVTSRHVLYDKPTGHAPTRIEIELHIDPANIAASSGFSIPLYQAGRSVWRQGTDTVGKIDVAVIPIERSVLSPYTLYRAFTPRHLLGQFELVEVGTALLILGFPLGFHDTHAPCSGGPSQDRRLVLWITFPGTRLFPDGCPHPPGQQWCAGSHADRQTGCRTPGGRICHGCCWVFIREGSTLARGT